MCFRFTSVFLVLSLIASAQTFVATIRGSILDSSGAIVMGATVTVTNLDTSATLTATSAANGEYLIANVPPGIYRVVIESPGFKKVDREPVRVDLLQNVGLDFRLEPGNVTESVQVTGETPLLDTSSASLGQVVDTKKIEDLPLNGRNVMTLVGLTPGVTPDYTGTFGGNPVESSFYTQGDFSVNSGLQMQSESLIDGVPVNTYLWNGPAILLSVDATSEFKVQTNGYSAEFGHTGSGIINTITRSGTNEFHGTIYEFLRNSALDANNFFSNMAGQRIPPYTFNQFGASIGGPVILPRYNGHNRTFFFGNYEGFRENAGKTLLLTVPTAPQQAGDFSQTRIATGAPITIYDPLTVQTTPGVGSGYQRTAFPNNKIPISRLDPAALNLIKLFPLPNAPGTGPAQINNFVANPTLGNAQDQWTARVDQNFNDSNRLFGRVSYERLLPGSTQVFNTLPGALPYTVGGSFNDPLLEWSWNGALDDSWVINPTTVVDFRYGFTRQTQFRDPASLGFDLTSLGFSSLYNNGVQIRTLPSLNIAGFQAVGEGGNIYFRRGENVHAAVASLNKTTSTHNLRVGLEFRSYLFNDTRAPAASGTYTFSAAFTQQDPLRAASNSGNALASFLLGLPAAGSTQYFPSVSFNQKYYATYIQDDYRITPTLTLNLGLRYEVETPKTERYNRISIWDPAAPLPISNQVGLNLRGGLDFPGTNGVMRGQWNTDWSKVSPRVGLAWKVTPKTVLRAGYGIFYSGASGQGGLVGNGNDGFGVTNSMVTSQDGGITPAAFLSNPFPTGFTKPAGSSLGLNSQLGQSLTPWSVNFPAAMTQQYNLSVQREFSGGLLAEAAFVGSRATHIPLSVPIDQLPAQYLSKGSSLLTQVPNPFYGMVTSGPLSTATIAAERLLVPYPQFAAVNLYTPIGQATYDALQVRVEKRFYQGLSLLGAYTFGKSLTDAGGLVWSSFNTPSIQNYYNLRGEKSISPFDVSNRLVVSMQYELPFGKGKALLPNSHGIMQALAGGWQLNSIGVMQAGTPLALTTSVNQTNALAGTSRPNIAPGASPNLSSGQGLNQWFDTNVFSQPPAFSFGNVSRTLPSTRGPALQNFDVSLFKSTRLYERMTVQLRLEAFNILNRANFGLPGTVFGTAQFGVISTAGAGRIFQVAAKIKF